LVFLKVFSQHTVYMRSGGPTSSNMMNCWTIWNGFEMDLISPGVPRFAASKFRAFGGQGLEVAKGKSLTELISSKFGGPHLGTSWVGMFTPSIPMVPRCVPRMEDLEDPPMVPPCPRWRRSTVLPWISFVATARQWHWPSPCDDMYCI
jgi:hypothetical protein